MALTVLVIDDAEVARAGLVSALSAGGFDVVGSVGTSADAERLAAHHKPDVAVVDLRLPDATGLEVAARILKLSPATKVLFVTAHEGDVGEEVITSASSSGLLLKTAPLEELCKAVEHVAQGRRVLDPVIAKSLVGKLGHRRSPDPLSNLTSREREVFKLLARGCGETEISEQLKISRRTAKNYVARVLQKLGLRRRSQVPAFAAKTPIDE